MCGPCHRQRGGCRTDSDADDCRLTYYDGSLGFVISRTLWGPGEISRQDELICRKCGLWAGTLVISSLLNVFPYRHLAPVQEVDNRLLTVTADVPWRVRHSGVAISLGLTYRILDCLVSDMLYRPEDRVPCRNSDRTQASRHIHETCPTAYRSR